MLYEMLNSHVSRKTSFFPLVDISLLIIWLSVSVIPVTWCIGTWFQRNNSRKLLSFILRDLFRDRVNHMRVCVCVYSPFSFSWYNIPLLARGLHYQGFTINPWHSTFDMTPLDEWSAWLSDLFLKNTQHSQESHNHTPGRMRILNPSKRAAADTCARLRGHWDRLCTTPLLNKTIWRRHFRVIIDIH